MIFSYEIPLLLLVLVTAAGAIMVKDLMSSVLLLGSYSFARDRLAKYEHLPENLGLQTQEDHSRHKVKELPIEEKQLALPENEEGVETLYL